MPHISIKAEPIFELFNLVITNSLLSSYIVLFLFLALAVWYREQANRRNKTLFYYAIRALLKELYTLFAGVVEGKIGIFFPILGTFFIFVMLQNWFGLLPGVGSVLIKVKEHGEETMAPLLRGGSADLNTTLALGAIAVFFVQYYGIKHLGFGKYIAKFINFSNPISFFLGILEIVSEFSRVISFSFRLFGNIFAGEVLLTIISFLVPFLVSFPFLIMELFVGVVQAFIFSMLTAVFLQMAVSEHH